MPKCEKCGKEDAMLLLTKHQVCVECVVKAHRKAVKR